MEVVKAIKRLAWRFQEATKNNNTFTINQNDLDALNGIAKYIEQTQKQQYIDNQLFAKLFIKVYAKMIEHYNTDILDPIPRKAMYHILETPMDRILQEFTDEMNFNQKVIQLQDAGINFKHPLTQTDKETIHNTKTIKELLKTAENDYLEDSFDVEFVAEGLKIEINNALNLFKN